LRTYAEREQKAAMSRVASVLLPLPLPEAFDYAVEEDLPLAVGDHVAAPLGPRQVRGVVTAVREAQGVNRPLKSILGRLDNAPLPVNTLAFIDWAARYACQPPGEALAMTLRGLRAPPPKPERRLILTGAAPARITPARTRVLETLAADGVSMPPAALAEAAGVSSGVIRGLIDDGVLAVVELAAPLPFGAPAATGPAATLNASQAAAAEALMRRLGQGGFNVALLDGVTGSGKTEVYLEAVAALMAEAPDAQVLVLLPEIALTQAVLQRFEARFAAAPAEWHSAVPQTKRRQVWDAVADGRCRIVVGARSALFLPFKALRLIVVDEEHDGSFKQEEGFVYHARDLAVARARIEGAGVVLASATPSLESIHNAQTGRYLWLKLAARHGGAQLPDITLIDLRDTPPERSRWLSPPLVRAMVETYARGEQSLLFLNRRGYAPLVLCKACGERMTAPDSQSWLVEHRYSGRLVCHLTGWSMAKPDACPHCGAKDSLVSIGPGVERLEEEARGLFPEARIAVFSSDTAPTGEAARALVGRMTAGEIDILVATQAAAKGHNFPNLTLVGVVDADLGLRGGDLRAAERTFQLLAQATGRAGRPNAEGESRPGRALIQTYAPEHAVMQALMAQDRDAFLAAESRMRELSGLPPYGRLAALILSSADSGKLDDYARALAAAIPNADGLEVYGPVDAPLALIRGVRRKRFLVRADKVVDLQAFLTAWRARAKPPSAVRLQIDVDPYSFL
jgi:primosomal protein N' (replication factor Y)